MRLLMVTAVQREADALGDVDDAVMVVSGVGRTNAAAATTEAILEEGPFDLVISAGVAGALPGALPGVGLDIGEVVVASECVYMEEGIITPEGFLDTAEMGFPLGDFVGNAVPVDPRILELVSDHYRTGPIATVATCSGTDEAARGVVERTGALAEAMEGAAVVQAARRLGVPGIEVRSISNTTGDREGQRWDLEGGLAALGRGMGDILNILGTT